MSKGRQSGPLQVGTETVNYQYVDADGKLGQLGVPIDATAAELNNAASASSRVQELTVTGTATPGVQSLELNHGSTPVVVTVASALNHPGLFIVKDTSGSGTESHTVTLSAGTFDGTNNKITLNAPKEAIAVYFDSAGAGTILENVGGVALASV
jgi:hypothetical protein